MSEFSCRVRRHGRHHIELKTHLPIPQESRGKYDLNFYFFSPAQLRFNKETVSVDKALNNIKTYTRFSSPVLPLSALVSSECELSPLNRIAVCLGKMENAEHFENIDLIYELQTLVNSFRGEMKSFAYLLRNQLKENRCDAALYKQRIGENFKQIEKILNLLRGFFPMFLDSRIDDDTRTALSWADEAMGIIAIKSAVKIHALINDDSTNEPLALELQRFVTDEHNYRSERKYVSAFDSDESSSRENLAYRESILKKWTQSVMYMECRESKIPKTFGHVLSGLAAAAAMTFAVLAAVYAEHFFIKNTTPWAVFIILSYVFKDRIKEILREAFSRLLPRMAADRIYKLIDPSTRKRAAGSQIIARFVREKHLSEEIRTIRDAGRNTFHSILPPENVFHYHRFISLNSRLLRAAHTRHNGITEVLRIRIDDFLKEMDETEEVNYKLVKGKRIKVSGNRVYHIHLVISLGKDSKRSQPQIFHYCLILNRSGIVRVEERPE